MWLIPPTRSTVCSHVYVFLFFSAPSEPLCPPSRSSLISPGTATRFFAVVPATYALCICQQEAAEAQSFLPAPVPSSLTHFHSRLSSAPTCRVAKTLPQLPQRNSTCFYELPGDLHRCFVLWPRHALSWFSYFTHRGRANALNVFSAVDFSACEQVLCVFAAQQMILLHV